MYEFITGPLLWLSFAICITGLVLRAVYYIRGLDWRIDRVAYRPHMKLGIRGAISSIVHWLVPFGTHGWRAKPLYTIIFFVFHIGLVVTPLFLYGHAVMIEQRWGIDWPSIPMGLADVLTIGAIVGGIAIAIRRIALPEVRILTTLYDMFLIVLSLTPFITGFVAVHQMGDYEFWLYTHILSGQALLIAIPYTKLFHVIGFFLTRAQIGMDFGIKRGYKGKGFAW